MSYCKINQEAKVISVDGNLIMTKADWAEKVHFYGETEKTNPTGTSILQLIETESVNTDGEVGVYIPPKTISMDEVSAVRLRDALLYWFPLPKEPVEEDKENGQI
jgi:hypothetical protein